jgi:prepilin peptidase CpaA
MWAIASLTLIVGFVDDVRSRKVHNPLVILMFVLTLVGTVYVRGVVGSIPGIAALMIALLATVPMFALGILGGGDVKLFAVFALALDVPDAMNTLLYSLIWGALFGLSRAAVSKNLLTLVRNTYRVGMRQRTQVQEVQKIPYTFALLLGWFTQLTLLRGGH